MPKNLIDLLLSKTEDHYDLLLALEKELSTPTVSPTGELLPEPSPTDKN